MPMLQLCTLADLPEGSARGFAVLHTHVLAVRDHRGVYVYLNRCPHLGVPLQWQEDRFLDEDSNFIRCASHGALFERATGLCLQGPCQGDSLWQIESRIEDEAVFIDDDELPTSPAVYR
jgi:nitrite reductase/ring-hydroxylating ferredoxin subunit